MTSEIAVALRLTGQDFSPEKVTPLLGVSPTKTWRLGDTVQNTLLKITHDGWEFALPVPAVLDLEAQLCALLDLFESRRHSVLEVCDRFGLEVEVACAVYVTDEAPIMHLSSRTMRRIATFNADLDIDLILLPSENEAGNMEKNVAGS
ncbi:MAG: DUF4279 domain-containing protein [Candidatus Entotheonellia bacterium]